MKKHDSSSLSAHVVWVPKLGGSENVARDAAKIVADPRSRHYWDPDGWFMTSYREVLAIPEDAWDIYLVYGPDARWDGDNPPKPDYWMHQLGAPGSERVDGPYLDAATFTERAVGLLPAAKGS